MPAPEECKFAKMCRHYSSSSYTCKFDEEAAVYCGVYDLFDNYRSPVMEKLERDLFTS